MASNEDKRNTSTGQENTNDSKPRFENPFIAFRRFADETIGSALQSIIGLPSAVTKQLEGALPGLEKIRNDNARQREEAESLRDKFGREQQQLGNLEKETSNQDSEAPHELIEELKRRRNQHRKRWEHIREAIHQGPDAAYTSKEMVRKGDEDDAAWSAIQSLRNKTREPNNPPMSRDDFMEQFFGSMGMRGPNTFGPLGAAIFSTLNTIMSSDGFGPYLIFSPYSPLFLSNRMNATSDKHPQDSFPYCDAFEDLLLASRGMDMVSLTERRMRKSALPQYPGHSQDITLAASWLSKLQRQGLLDGFPRAEERLEEDDGTELAMYSRFLSSAFPKPPAHTPEEQPLISKETVTQNNEFDQQRTLSSNGILSTLTRTESKRYPDGRVETKVVLIKHFADGGETRTETVHTKHEDVDRRGSDDSKAKEEKKGWFWN